MRPMENPMRTLIFLIVPLVLASIATPALALTCPTGFLEVANAQGELGCIQADIERRGGTAVQRSWPDANRACFADYGGRLPTPGEVTIAEDVVTLISPTAPVWTDDVFFDANEYAVTARIPAPGNIDYGFSLLALDGFQRCWIPAEVRLLSFVPGLGIWSLGALAAALTIAGMVAVRRGRLRRNGWQDNAATQSAGWEAAVG